MRVATIICSFNSQDLTKRVYDEMKANKGHDIFVLENSTDESKMFKCPETIDLGRNNVGYGGMHDFIYKDSRFRKYDFVGVINNDVYDIPTNYIEKLREQMKSDVGIVTSSVYDGGSGWRQMIHRGKGFREVETIEDMAAYRNTKLFDKLDSYSPHHRFGIVDIQHSRVYREAGYKLIIVDDVPIRHMLSGARKAAGTEKEYYDGNSEENNRWFNQYPRLKELYFDWINKYETISVIIPNYNDNNLLPRAIESVLNQQGNFKTEVVLVDDHSDIEPLDIVEKYKIKYVHHDKNKGLAAARNSGIKASYGEWILPLDADDELIPGSLQKLYTEKKNNDIIFGKMKFRDGSVLEPSYPKLNFNPEEFMNNNHLFGTTLYRKEIWNNINGYWEEKEYYEDWCFWAKAAFRGYKFYYIPEPIYIYEGGQDRMCARLGKEREMNVNKAVNYLRQWRKQHSL